MVETPKIKLYQRKPEWLRVKLPNGAKAMSVLSKHDSLSLHSICASGICPNRGECWKKGTATFMICGDVCTRGCRFCNVATGRPNAIDSSEAERIAATVSEFGLRHIVLTSVDRDDLADGGASHWAHVIRTIRGRCPGITMETLIPDFSGNVDALNEVLDERPEIVSHNMETVRRLTPAVRSRATYEGSIAVIRHISGRGLRAKSGIMLGLGETFGEVLQTMDDLREAGCEVMTIGQYLQPTERHYPVSEYVHPEVFEQLREEGLKRGFRHVESAPLVRSSYHAEKHLL